MQRLAHAVQPLELEGRPVELLRHVEHRGDGMGVVGGELRIEPVGPRKQRSGVGDVAHVRSRVLRVNTGKSSSPSTWACLISVSQ